MKLGVIEIVGVILGVGVGVSVLVGVGVLVVILLEVIDGVGVIDGVIDGVGVTDGVIDGVGVNAGPGPSFTEFKMSAKRPILFYKTPELPCPSTISLEPVNILPDFFLSFVPILFIVFLRITINSFRSHFS